MLGFPARALAAGEGGGAEVGIGKQQQFPRFMPGNAEPPQVRLGKAEDLAEKLHRRG